MSLLEHSSSLASHLGALAQRLGLRGRLARQILRQASQLRLPFQPLPPLPASIWWEIGAPLQHLPELPRSALSGPVQQDKADAHAMLVNIVKRRSRELSNLDLRQIEGLHSTAPHAGAYACLEEYAAAPECRHIRIISYKDFLRTLDLALPTLTSGAAVALHEASWRGPRLFWAGEQHGAALACAVVYARRRELEMTVPAHINSYRLSRHGLADLQQRFHMLAMPVHAWSDPAFMGLLLDNGLPYSRLALLRTTGAPECLLLPRHNAEANALGEGLRLAGAPNLVSYLQRLPR